MVGAQPSARADYKKIPVLYLLKDNLVADFFVSKADSTMKSKLNNYFKLTILTIKASHTECYLFLKIA